MNSPVLTGVGHPRRASYFSPTIWNQVERLNDTIKECISEKSVEKVVTPDVPDQEPERPGSCSPPPSKPESHQIESVEAEPQSIGSQPSDQIPTEPQKTIDDIIDVNNYPIFECMNIEESLRKKIVYCCHYFSTWIIFITEEDEVYSFGWNGNKCLGLGDRINRTKTPALNINLSNKKLIDIACGLNHCIGLTRDGVCYAWGDNRNGQLGCGPISLQTPQVIKHIRDYKVVRVSCGSEHSMALTNDGQVFVWGANNLGQLGDGHIVDCPLPCKIVIDEPISSISCGRFHSLALSTTGKVFVWGINDRGQLGRHYSEDATEDDIEKPICTRPSLVHSLDNVVVRKAVCGPSHCLILSVDGEVYAFGGNDSGQAGSGTKFNVFQPQKILNKVKDIITTARNNLSLAINEDNDCFIWGLVNTKPVYTPEPILLSNERSIFDVYAKRCRYKVLFKTLVVHEDDKYCITNDFRTNARTSRSNNSDKMSNIESSLNDLNDQVNDQLDKDHLYNLKDHRVKSISSRHYSVDNSRNDIRSLQRLIENLIESKEPKISNTESSADSHDSYVLKALKNRLKASFNNPKDSNLKFISDNKIIYCQKSFLKFRNKKFWKKIKPNIDDDKEIRISPERFEECFEFLKWLHGIEPEFKDTTVFRVQAMAKVFDEKELMDQCFNYINLTVCVDNVCALYQKSITIDSFDLEKSCIEFTAKNLEAVIKTEAFKKLNHLTKTRLITSISNC